ncbi:hypothetical protein [Amycolatopsis sp. cmx-11-51]|uniref:hypothetical protein n=1 Tax=unclassified Amycolatopsis TaxID=2618356 RepID=UPI0039E3FAE5
MTDVMPQSSVSAAAETVSFRSADAVLLFSRRALTAIHHATHHGLFTLHEASAMADRVRTLTAETLMSLAAATKDQDGLDRQAVPGSTSDIRART